MCDIIDSADKFNLNVEELLGSINKSSNNNCISKIRLYDSHSLSSAPLYIEKISSKDKILSKDKVGSLDGIGSAIGNSIEEVLKALNKGKVNYKKSLSVLILGMSYISNDSSASYENIKEIPSLLKKTLDAVNLVGKNKRIDADSQRVKEIIHDNMDIINNIASDLGVRFDEKGPLSSIENMFVEDQIGDQNINTFLRDSMYMNVSSTEDIFIYAVAVAIIIGLMILFVYQKSTCGGSSSSHNNENKGNSSKEGKYDGVREGSKGTSEAGIVAFVLPNDIAYEAQGGKTIDKNELNKITSESYKFGVFNGNDHRLESSGFEKYLVDSEKGATRYLIIVEIDDYNRFSKADNEFLLEDCIRNTSQHKFEIKSVKHLSATDNLKHFY